MNSWSQFFCNAFAMPRKPPLADADRELAQWVARELRQRKLDMPAMMVIESCQPLAGVAAQLMIFLEPSLALFLPPREITRFREFIEKEGALELLSQLLDGPPKENITSTANSTQAGNSSPAGDETSRIATTDSSPAVSPSSIDSSDTTEKP
ncbi:MAG: hypothetical protein C0478_07230 [Planctomyces sp.]|nr:hypothetical protein [Planctomyces sp.]